MKFGDILKELLDDNNISQKQLASDLHIGATTIGNYVRGAREPDFEILKLLASYFNVTTDYMLDHRSYIETDHNEEALLRIYRNLSSDNQELLLEQSKLLLRHNMRNASKIPASAMKKGSEYMGVVKN